MILDSNIIIYSALPENGHLRQYIAKNSPFASALSKVEVLGFHNLTDEDKRFFDMFFEVTALLPISDAVLEKAVELRQMKKMSLCDLLIAGTALVHDLGLVTANRKDFDWIGDLAAIDPPEN